jgi:hypothetical protein
VFVVCNANHQTTEVVNITPLPRDIFLKKIGSGTQIGQKFGQRWGGVSYINSRKKRFQNTIPVCTLLRKNFQNGVLEHSATKKPMPLPTQVSTMQKNGHTHIYALSAIQIKDSNVQDPRKATFSYN